MTPSYHIPVLLSEVLSLLSISDGAWYIDGTLGGGGYSAGILRSGGKIIGIDQDKDAIDFTRTRLNTEFPELKEGIDWILVQDNFRNIESIVQSLNVSAPAGVVFDLGVSSYQLDQKHRGFSYRFEDAPLDLRMDQSKGMPASHNINTFSKEELYDIFTKYGEEERSRTIVNAVTNARRIKPIETVGDLIRVLETVGGEKDRILARVFQALRISVNDELSALQEGLVGAEHILVHSGILVVVSFHSLEDRYVKRFFQRKEWQKISDVVRATEGELEHNSRSRSAKLRAGRKIL